VVSVDAVAGDRWPRGQATLQVRGVQFGRPGSAESVMTTRERLEQAFDLRGMAPGTREAYGFCINRYERFFGRPADALGRQEVETFLLHLVRERKLSPGAHNVYAAALRRTIVSGAGNVFSSSRAPC
jgi:hypothetical protein